MYVDIGANGTTTTLDTPKASEKVFIMTDQELIADFKNAYRSGCDFLVIYSRKQDIGIAKCERGVELGYLRFEEVEIDEQETHWRYYWTAKAKRDF